MLKKIFLGLIALLATMNFALAAVEVNTADQAALDSIKGIGPKTSEAIVKSREKEGKFKNWADFQSRVSGIGTKRAAKLSEAGLTVDGQTLQTATAGSSMKNQKAMAATKAATPVAPASTVPKTHAKTTGTPDAAPVKK